MTSLPVHPPDDPVLTQKYRLDELLGSGAQAHVWRGVQIGLGRPVAIKILRTAAADRVFSRHAQRFEREARLVSKLRDPHTITLYDFGTLSAGSMFMVFELVEGVDLQQLLASGQTLGAGRVVKILRQTLLSLQEAHSLGVLHRDIKPSNLMLYEHAGRRDLIKLLDFGIAKILGHGSRPITEVGKVVGTPRYMPPEATNDTPYTAASDLYSLGLVAYELLTGKPAIPGESTMMIIAAIIDDTPITLPDDLTLPAALRSIIERMVARDPAARYQSAEHVLSDLQRWLEHAPLHTQEGSFDIDLTPSMLDQDASHDRLTAPLQSVGSSAHPPSLAAASSQEEIPTQLVDALQPQEVTTAKLNALDLAPRDSGPTMPLTPVRPVDPPAPADPEPTSGSTLPLAPVAQLVPVPTLHEISEASEASITEPPGAPDGSLEPGFSGASGTGATSTERFPHMVHRTVGAPRVDPSLKVERSPHQRPAVTPSKLARPAELAPEPAAKPRLETLQVEYVPSHALPSPQRRTPWDALGVPAPVFAFALALLVVLVIAVCAVFAIASM
jgi:serine/threonine protein kinase